MMKSLLINRDFTSLLNNKKLQTILAIVPITLLVLAILSYFGIFFSMFNTLDTQLGHIGNPKALLNTILGNLIIFIFLVSLSFLIGILSFVFFIVHTLKNPNLTKNDDRLLWILAIIFFNVFGILFYWILQIKRKNPRPVVDFFSNEV